ncbi:uncharacterized protein EMH_0100720 [Eimeria mitis]|uniref:Uncharacterized protein n=1 Tax=Eimeria mitis TaxID=44415 RepID=U6KG52_9EIME|nr:uncharacterized protein EMH_0100720 [Eimeria mitis]CDJ35766.1 hypothetical protein, conserved [Eimeria mitis]
MSTMLARNVADTLKDVEDAKAALHKPANAEEDTEEGSRSAAARTEELLGASQAAAKAATDSLNLAGLIWLNILLKKSLEVDMRMSTTRVREATATVRRAIGEEAQQQHEHIEMSAADIQEFEELLAQFNSGQEKAQSANGPNELASAVAGMKQAAIKLMIFVEERQKQLTKR